MWIVISRSCADCGAEMTVLLIDRKPSDADIREAEQDLGGMTCIETIWAPIELNKLNSIKSLVSAGTKYPPALALFF